MSDYRMAKKSYGEEKKAVHDYSERREDSKDKDLKKAFNHAIPEEKHHAKLFKRVMNKYSDGAIKYAKKMRGGE